MEYLRVLTFLEVHAIQSQWRHSEMPGQAASHQSTFDHNLSFGQRLHNIHHAAHKHDSETEIGPSNLKNLALEHSENISDGIDPIEDNVNRNISHSAVDNVPGSANRHSVDRFNHQARKALGKRDYVAAFEFQREAALLNDARSKVRLGFMYSAGQGVKKNDQEAVYWFRDAAEQGEPRGQYQLGLRYYYGLNGVQKDVARAIYWFKKSAGQHHLPAMLQIGNLYEKGFGVAQDHTKAAKLIAYALRGQCCEAITAMEIDSDSYSKLFRIEMQRILRSAGVYLGLLDGNFGVATIAALKKYRKNLPDLN